MIYNPYYIKQTKLDQTDKTCW